MITENRIFCQYCRSPLPEGGGHLYCENIVKNYNPIRKRHFANASYIKDDDFFKRINSQETISKLGLFHSLMTGESCIDIIKEYPVSTYKQKLDDLRYGLKRGIVEYFEEIPPLNLYIWGVFNLRY